MVERIIRRERDGVEQRLPIDDREDDGCRRHGRPADELRSGAPERIGGGNRQCRIHHIAPVAVNPVDKDIDDKEQNERPQQCRQQEARLIPGHGRAPQAGHGEDQDERRRQQELLADELRQVVPAAAVGEAKAAELKTQGPAAFMRHVPDDVGRENESGDHATQPRPRCLEPAPSACREHKPEEHARADEQDGVFREQPEAREQPRRKPPASVLAGVRLGHGPDESGAAEDERRVGRRQDRDGVHHQRQVEEQRGAHAVLRSAEQQRAGAPHA
jgi:hypothetical protein